MTEINNDVTCMSENGGEKGTYQNPYSAAEYDALSDSLRWPGGYVRFGSDIVYMGTNEVTVYPSSGSDSSSGSSSGSDGSGSDSSDSGSGSSSGSGSGSSYGSGPRNGAEILERAREYEGVPYLSGGMDKTGIDCSGLISVVLGLSPRWTTRSGDIPGMTLVTLSTTGKNIVTELQIGDILVWVNHHAAIYGGINSEGKHQLFHAHGRPDEQKLTGFTPDHEGYWLAQRGTPKVYRK